MKIPISTIRAIISAIKCYETAWKRTCVYIVLMHERRRDHSWKRAEHSWVSGSENSLYTTTCFLGGFQVNLSLLIQKQYAKYAKTAYSVVRHDWNFKWHWHLWSDETKKWAFKQQILKMGLVITRITSTPCVQWNILLYFNVVVLYFCWRSWTSCLDTWHHGFYQIPKDKTIISDWLVINLIMGQVWIFQPYNNPNTNVKNNTKIWHWAQNQASTMVPWSAPYRKWMGWTEEEKHRHGAGYLKDLEWFWMKEWSLISCQVFSNLIR